MTTTTKTKKQQQQRTKGQTTICKTLHRK